MKKNVFMYLAVTALLFIGCTKMEQVYPVPSGELSNVPVELSGAINEGGTRAPITGANPGSDLPLSVFRADATAGTTYAGTYTNKLGGTFKQSGVVELSPAQYYLVDGTRYTKFIAVYPQVADAQYDPDARTVEYTIDGTTDILASGLVQGSKGTVPPALAFTHKLTQVRVNVIAHNTADIPALPTVWGNITGITLHNKAVTAVLTLPTPTAGTASIAAKATPQGPLPLTATHSGGGGGLAIPITSTEFGYALFVPVTTADKLRLDITTTTTGATPKVVETSELLFEEGKIYTITIAFKTSGGAEVVSVTNTGSIALWTNGSDINGAL